MTRDEIYGAALMHDIGKFAERTKEMKVDKKFQNGKTGHAKCSTQLLDVLTKNNKYFGSYSEEFLNGIHYHHEPRNDYEKIIQLADWLSSSERSNDKENKEFYIKVPLESIFSRLFNQNIKSNRNYYYSLKQLKLENIFPEPDRDFKLDKYSYQNLFNKFLEEVGKIENQTQLYYLLEKYLWCIPAQTSKYIPDISLFDHLRTTAAIALCLFDQYQNEKLTQDDLKKMDKSKKSQFILIKGDISGIQEFIFSIPSKGAAKSLKGRSVYISIITDIVVRYILDKLELKESNLLYSGGGNFYILAPHIKKNLFEEVKNEISKKILEPHEGSIYIAMDNIGLSPYDLTDFSKQWDIIKEKIDVLKEKRWSDMGLAENFNKIFGPFDDGAKENQHCYICRVADNKINLKIHRFDESDGEKTEKKICSLCGSFIELTNKLKNANFYSIEKTDKEKLRNFKYEKEISYEDVIRSFGYKISLDEDMVKANNEKIVYTINNTDFLDKGCSGFKMGAYNLPSHITFEDISNKSKGDKKLGILKLDVDNLGSVFGEGLGDNNSISRVASLSRMMGLYFEGYINKFIEENQWNDKIYVVFSGGDDTFVIGAWDCIFKFAYKFYNEFRRYTCYNEKLTFSAGIGVYRYNYPVIKAAEITEEALESAKGFIRDNDDMIPKKNKISLFGEIFTWEEFEKIASLKNLLIEIIEKGEKEYSESFGRAFLYKIEKSTLGFKQILKKSTEGKFENIRFWRLAYYLSDLKTVDEKDGTKYAEKLISEYKEIVINNLMEKNTEKKIKNIMIIPAAVRWAEMETRRGREE